MHRVAILTDREFRSYVLCTRRFGRGIKTDISECKECDHYEGTSPTESTNPFKPPFEVMCTYEGENEE